MAPRPWAMISLASGAYRALLRRDTVLVPMVFFLCLRAASYWAVRAVYDELWLTYG
jgi:hypothetical protein